jgi:hypothetical protein
VSSQQPSDQCQLTDCCIVEKLYWFKWHHCELLSWRHVRTPPGISRAPQLGAVSDTSIKRLDDQRCGDFEVRYRTGTLTQDMSSRTIDATTGWWVQSTSPD